MDHQEEEEFRHKEMDRLGKGTKEAIRPHKDRREVDRGEEVVHPHRDRRHLQEEVGHRMEMETIIPECMAVAVAEEEAEYLPELVRVMEVIQMMLAWTMLCLSCEMEISRS